MYHKQLVNHVSSKLKEGMDTKKIEQELSADGWTEDDIKEAFYYSSYPEKLRHLSIIRTLHSEMPASLTLALAGLILILLGFYFFYFKSVVVGYNITLPGIPGSGKVTFTYGGQPALSDPDFFAKVRNQFISDKANFVEADLSSMILRVYKFGKLSLEVPINSKGREGSWWETPAGLYQINKKEEKHFSGMGHVWMPWSMNFQGNFYIHGRTYYPDGTLTAKEFTGGCIRLSTEDAERVYKEIDTGTPLLVFEHSFSPDAYSYKNEEGPNLSANAYLSADLRNNHVFASKDSTKEVSIASITKLMTALIATEYINLDNTATVPKDAIVYTSKSRLKAGDEYTVYQLLFPLLMESSNEAAETIARFYGRSSFIKHMNEKAISIGMAHTKFDDPSGASSGNISSAEDLFMLTKYIYNNRSFIFNITSGKVKDSAYGGSGFSDLGNFNDFLDNEFFFGGKNGKATASEETSLSVFDFPVGETKRPVVVIVLGTTNGQKDAQALLDYTLNHFR